MRHLVWIAGAFVLFLLACAVTAWPAMRDLYDYNPSRLARMDVDAGSLGGIGFQIDTATAMILPQTPDRAIVLVRLGVKGKPQGTTEWISGEVSLTDRDGRRWRPMGGMLGQKIADLLGGPEGTGRNLRQTLAASVDDTAPDGVWQGSADETFVVPAKVLTELRLEIWDRTTLPDALSLPIRPVVRPAP